MPIHVLNKKDFIPINELHYANGKKDVKQDKNQVR